MKIDRKRVYNKYNGHCAYCGCKLEFKDMQVDHFIAKRICGTNDFDNLMPSCHSCNRYKNAETLDQFRRFLEQGHVQLRRDSFKVRIMERFNLLEFKPRKLKFYFEIIEEKKNENIK